MPRRIWTEEEDARLLDLRAKGLPLWQIAKLFDVSEQAVYDRLRRIDPALRPWDLDDDLILMRRSAEGATYAEIAAELARSVAAVRNRWALLMGETPHMEKGRAPREAEGAVVENVADACEKHLQAILAANPNGFLAWSEKRVGVRGVAPCAPAFHPMLRRAA